MKIKIIAILCFLALIIPAHAEHIRNDGMGGFYTDNGHVRSDGFGGYYTNDDHVRSDGLVVTTLKMDISVVMVWEVFI